MSLGHGSRIVTDGLVFAYDMGSKQSWKGKPTTNLCPNADFSNGLTNWTFYAGLDYDVGDYFGEHNVLRVKRIAGATGYIGPKYTTAIPILPSVNYTCTIRFYLTQQLEQTVRYYFTERDAANVLINWRHYITLGPSTPINTWLTWTYTWTSASNADHFAGLSFDWNTTASSIDETVYIDYFQIEQSSFATPFVNGTRSNTEAIIDWRGGNTITANSLTYNSDNTFSFNGTGDYLTIGNYKPTDQTCTYEVWCKSTDEALLDHVTNIIGKGNWNDGAGNYFTLGYKNGNTLIFSYRSSWTLNGYSLSNFDATSWNHIVGVCDGTTDILYLNGNIVASNAVTAAHSENVYEMQIGRSSYYSNYYPGSIDSVKIYNRALTQQEIKQNFNALRGRFGL